MGKGFHKLSPVIHSLLLLLLGGEEESEERGRGWGLGRWKDRTQRTVCFMCNSIAPEPHKALQMIGKTGETLRGWEREAYRLRVAIKKVFSPIRGLRAEED